MEMIGKILANRYEILEKRGSGGMADVFKARDRLLNRYVAVKVLKDELRDDKEFVERFKIEAQSAAGLSHPNIVSVHDVGVEDGIHYFIMEYVDGMSLKDYVKHVGALDWREATEFAISICSAIDHAHKKNIIHRDIKSHNILLTREGVVKVADFGIARAVTSSTVVNGGKNVVGSVHYFSPEQALGKAIDFKSDIYSIGVVLYEMLTGRLPFIGDSAFQVARMQIETPPRPPIELNAAIPQAVNDITLKALQKQPQKRYQSAAEMQADLKAVLHNPAIKLAKDLDETQFMSSTQTETLLAQNPDDTMVNGDTFSTVLSHMSNDSTVGGPYQTPGYTAPKQQLQEGGSDEKKKKSKFPLWITLIVIIALGAGVGAYFLLGEDSKTMSVPNLLGMTFDEAARKYENEDVILIKEGEDYSDDYDEGQIMEQTPQERERVEKPVEIRVKISLGKLELVLEDYKNRDYQDVEKELTDKGLSVKKVFEKNDEYPKDVIYDQSPASGSQMQKGERITLYISNGPSITKVKVPNLIGRSEEDAKALLKSKNLLVGTIQPQESELPKGTVLSQTIDADTEVNENTEISFTISTGQKATPTPTETPEKTPEETPKSTPTHAPESTPAGTGSATEANGVATSSGVTENQG